MRPRNAWIIAVLAVWLLLGGAQRAKAMDFNPELGQAREMIAGEAGGAGVEIPADAKELTAYPIPSEQPRELLTVIPGKEERQATPLPLAHAWWKVPFYVAVGLPRDLVDGLMGWFSYVPILNMPLVYLPYEVVPTQVVFRDYRDWHRWPGRRNARGHGMVDGESWGWFPSASTWDFTYASERKAARNMKWNAELKKQLQERNKEIELRNEAIAARTQETRAKALEAIQAGNGREAALRMIAYHRSYPLDEGAFALYVTSLALYAPEGPEWVAPLLWGTLQSAQPRVLLEAEKLLAATLKAKRDSLSLAKALIYTELLLGDHKKAQNAANQLLSQKINDPYRLRLVFETSLASRDADLARATFKALKPGDYDQYTWAMMQARLDLLLARTEPARQLLAQRLALKKEDPYVNYYLGCTELQATQNLDNPTAGFKRASDDFEAAKLRAPGIALAARAAEAQSYIDSMLRRIAASPELFPAKSAASAIPAAPATVAPPSGPASAPLTPAPARGAGSAPTPPPDEELPPPPTAGDTDVQ